MDRLIEAIDNTQNPSVVGLDPTEALVPPQVVASFADEVRDSVESPEEVESAQLAVAYFEYNRTIIDAIADIVPAVKPQIAMYEALGPAGVDIYTMTCEYAAQQGLYVLGDIKRGDIGSTAAAYAHHLNGVGDFDPWHEDAVTVNPYLGTDGITPFVEAAAEADKDIFVLVRTSNPSSSELQMLDLADGTKVYEPSARSSIWPTARRSTSTWPILWKDGAPRPSAATATPAWARWSAPPTPRKARRCVNVCRTRSSSCRATVRRAARPRTWQACSTSRAAAPSSTRRAALSAHGRRAASTPNP